MILLSEVCKSGFHHKVITQYNSSETFDKGIIAGLSSLVLSPQGVGPMKVVLKIQIPFLEAFKIMDKIIRYSHTVPTLDFVQFKDISTSDLYALCSTVLKSHQSIPFEIEEIAYYPGNYCFEAYIKIEERVFRHRYAIRNRWSGLFQQLFKTTKFNIIVEEKLNDPA